MLEAITLNMTVTQEMIDADNHGCSSCPWAMAAINALRDEGYTPTRFDEYNLTEYDVAVGTTTMSAEVIAPNGREYALYQQHLPSSVINWIRHYDGQHNYWLYPPMSETITLYVRKDR